MKKFITCNLDLLTSQLDLYYLHMGGGSFSAHGTFKDKFPFSTTDFNPSLMGLLFLSPFIFPKSSFALHELVGQPTARAGGVTSWLVPDLAEFLFEFAPQATPKTANM